MSNQKHTPGPWSLRGDSRRYEVVGQTPTGDTDPLAVCENIGTLNAANARLMAAAPTMYAIVKAEYDANNGFDTLPLGYSADRAKAIMGVVRAVEGGA